MSAARDAPVKRRNRRPAERVEPVPAAPARPAVRDMSIYARVLKLPDLPGFSACSKAEAQADVKNIATAKSKPVAGTAHFPTPTHGREHAQFVWALETAAFGQYSALDMDTAPLGAPAEAMTSWILSRIHVPATGVQPPTVTPAVARSHAVSLALNLRQRLDALALRREERDIKFLNLRREYITQLRAFVTDTREQMLALDALRSTLHKIGALPDGRSGQSRLNKLSLQNTELRSRLAAARNLIHARTGKPVPVFAKGDEVQTPMGPAIVVSQRDLDGMGTVIVQMAWGAVGYFQPTDLRFTVPRVTAQPNGDASATAAAAAAAAGAPAGAPGVGAVDPRGVKRKLADSSLDFAHGASSKLTDARDAGRAEAVTATLAESEADMQATLDSSGASAVFHSSWMSFPPRDLPLRLDPLLSNSTDGFIHGVQGDGDSPRRRAMPLSPKVRALQPSQTVDAVSASAPAASARAIADAQKYRAEVQRLKWDLKQTEDACNEQRSRLTEAREARTHMLQQLNAYRAEISELREMLRTGQTAAPQQPVPAWTAAVPEPDEPAAEFPEDGETAMLAAAVELVQQRAGEAYAELSGGEDESGDEEAGGAADEADSQYGEEDSSDGGNDGEGGDGEQESESGDGEPEGDVDGDVDAEAEGERDSDADAEAEAEAEAEEADADPEPEPDADVDDGADDVDADDPEADADVDDKDDDGDEDMTKAGRGRGRGGARKTVKEPARPAGRRRTTPTPPGRRNGGRSTTPTGSGAASDVEPARPAKRSRGSSGGNAAALAIGSSPTGGKGGSTPAPATASATAAASSSSSGGNGAAHRGRRRK